MANTMVNGRFGNLHACPHCGTRGLHRNTCPAYATAGRIESLKRLLTFTEVDSTDFAAGLLRDELERQELAMLRILGPKA